MATYKEQYYSLEESEMQDLISRAKKRRFKSVGRVIKSFQ
jgi:hypothetical protein